MQTDTEPSDLDRTQELFDFLQGVIPDGYKIRRSHIPKLTPEQAWTVIWYLGNLYWEPSDQIERCDICGDLYDSRGEGSCLDYGRGPYFFCDNCCNGPEYDRKRKSKLNPDKEQRNAD